MLIDLNKFCYYLQLDFCNKKFTFIKTWHSRFEIWNSAGRHHSVRAKSGGHTKVALTIKAKHVFTRFERFRFCDLPAAAAAALLSNERAACKRLTTWIGVWWWRRPRSVLIVLGLRFVFVARNEDEPNARRRRHFERLLVGPFRSFSFRCAEWIDMLPFFQAIKGNFPTFPSFTWCYRERDHRY